MRVKVVHVCADDPAPVAPPWVGLAVEAAVEEVKGLVGKDDQAVLAAPLEVALLIRGGRRRGRFGHGSRG